MASESLERWFRCIDGENTSVSVYTLHLPTMRWTLTVPSDNKETLKLPLQIAESDIIRAKQRVELEKNKAMSLGACLIRSRCMATNLKHRGEAQHDSGVGRSGSNAQSLRVAERNAPERNE